LLRISGRTAVTPFLGKGAGGWSTDFPPAALAWSVWGLGALLYLIGFYLRVAPAVITDQLMVEFAIGGAALGNLSAFYFYSYVAMQIPTGMIADRWGPRRLLTAGAGVAALGTALFAFAPTLFWANMGRLLIGASVAVAFVSMLKLASHWFSPKQYALASGMALLMGVVGGVVAGVPLRFLVEAFGWRAVMGVSAALTALLCVATWLRVRDDPAERGYASHFQGVHGAHASTSLWRGLMEVLSYRNVWILTAVPIGFSGAVLTFAGLWGVPFLRQVHGLDPKTAAADHLDPAGVLGAGRAAAGQLVGAHGPAQAALPDRLRRRAARLVGHRLPAAAAVGAGRAADPDRLRLGQHHHRLRLGQGIGAPAAGRHGLRILQHGAAAGRHAAAAGGRLDPRPALERRAAGRREDLRCAGLRRRLQPDGRHHGGRRHHPVLRPREPLPTDARLTP
jgi:predicted MFS family arabinose efflux permease